MNALWLIIFGIVAVVVMAAIRYAKPILASGHDFSSPGSLPLPGRFFGRRLKRWWRDMAPTVPEHPTGPPLRLRAWPMLDLEAGRLAGLLLDQPPGEAAPTAPANDTVRLERAVAHGRRLGWRHSSTAVIVPVAGIRSLLASTRSRVWETLERYSGDAVATVPPLVLLLDDLADLPDAAILERLGRLRVEVALGVERLPAAALPAVIERVFVRAAAALDGLEAVRALQAEGRAVVVTGVRGMAELERLAKAGLRCAMGPVFGAPQTVE